MDSSRWGAVDMLRNLAVTSLLAVFISLIGMGATPQHVYAADVPEAECSSDVTILGIIPAWYKYLDVQETSGECDIVLSENADGNTDWQKTVIAISFALLDILMRIAGLVAVVFVIVGGFTFITSNGQPERAKNARNTILNALIGVTITMVAAVVVNMVGKALIAT